MSLTSVKQGIKIADIHCEIECDSTLLSHLEPKLGGFFKNGVAPYKLVMRQNGPENSKWLNNAIPHMVPHPNKIIIRQDGIFELEMDLNTRCAELSYRLRPGDLTHRWPPRGPWMGRVSRGCRPSRLRAPAHPVARRGCGISHFFKVQSQYKI